MVQFLYSSQEGSRSRRSHDAELSPQPLSSKCSRHRGSLGAGCRGSPRGNNVPHDAELIADLLFLERSRRTRQSCIPIWLGEVCGGLIGHGDFSRNAVIRGGANEGVDFGARGRERGLVGLAEGFREATVRYLRVEEDGGGPALGLRSCQYSGRLPGSRSTYIGWIGEGWNGGRGNWRFCVDHEVASHHSRRCSQ